jgi:hypothetical protein
MSFWSVSVVPKYFNFVTFSNDSSAILIFWFCPEFWWRDIIIYFVFCAFISRPTSLLATKRFLCSLLWYLYYHSHRQTQVENTTGTWSWSFDKLVGRAWAIFGTELDSRPKHRYANRVSFLPRSKFFHPWPHVRAHFWTSITAAAAAAAL